MKKGYIWLVVTLTATLLKGVDYCIIIQQWHFPQPLAR